MNSTLYNGVSGIRTHQFGLDSVSNNIANINTTGYRANVPEFKSIFANQLNSTNPISSVSSDMNYGSTKAANAISNTDGSYVESEGELNIAYAGKGWFAVGKSEGGTFNVTEPNDGVYFTRDGSFSRDAEGYIVNASGHYLMGVDLGKIKDGLFHSDSANDAARLAATEIKPLQIPQELHFGPAQTNNIEVAINLNPNQATQDSHKLFLDGGVLSEAKILAQDLGSLVVGIENINAPSYNDATIRVTKNGESREIRLVYGEGENAFKTLGELVNLIEAQTGLTLALSRLPNGDIDPRLILELKNKSLEGAEVELGGKFFKRLGLEGARELKTLKAQAHNPSKSYEENELVRAEGGVFRSLKAANLAPLEDAESWEKLEAKVALFDPANAYKKNAIAESNGDIYIKITDENSDLAPAQDKENWRLLSSEKLVSEGLRVANYKTTSEIFDENGNKLSVISTFRLEDAQNRVWAVQSAVFDKNGEVQLGESIEHSIAFDGEGYPLETTPVTLKAGEREISYSLSGTPTKKSTSLAFIDSSVLETHKDGNQKGDLVHIGVDSDGLINLAFSNGKTETIGRVGIVAFVNDQGLQKIGGNLFEMRSISKDGGEAVISSGQPLIGWDENGKLRYGQVLHKYLETSNVDPAASMTDLIVFQRGYAMNAKAFTTGDDLIKEAINLKR